MENEKPKLVLFDWDGTLVDTLPLIRATMASVWISYGKGEFTEDLFEKILLMDPRLVFTALYGDQAEAARTMFYDGIESNHLSALQPFPYALDLIKFFTRQGIGQAVVSKKTRQYVVAEIVHLGLDSYFPCIVATGDSAREKPHPDPILKALEHFPGIDKGETWYVGDAESDMGASAAAGTKSALILHGKDKADLISRYAPAYVFRDLGDMLEFIKS